MAATPTTQEAVHSGKDDSGMDSGDGRPVQKNVKKRGKKDSPGSIKPSTPPLPPLPDLEAHGAAVESQFVQSVYNDIAPHFSETRYKPWPLVETFLNGLSPASLVADVGCGNGKCLGVNSALAMIGNDISEGLLAACMERNSLAEVFRCDNLALPMQSNRFDAVISIAVVHHFTTSARRCAAIAELLRIVKPGGLVLITVWAQEQNMEAYAVQDQFVPWRLKPKFQGRQDDSGVRSLAASTHLPLSSTAEDAPQPLLSSEAAGVAGEGEVRQATPQPLYDENGARVYLRYYHFFAGGELEGLCHLVGGNTLVNSAYDADNWYVIIRKDDPS